ncbi:unnamed protein product [Rotaria sp. Silwood1]|nr:unnamed protein product [Rotaria sp. Silwood1]CAF1405223.1 unnamed protein product [Rotaria sp. Silwood1]
MLLSFNDDIYIGLEHNCTQDPSWLADYVIENLIVIQQEKCKQKFQLLCLCIKFEIENDRLFPDLPEIPTRRILHFINDTIDLHSMQSVLKVANDKYKVDELIDATIKLRQYTANDILQLWEDFTHQNQSVGPILISKINYIRSNSFYYEIDKISDHYSVRLIIIGLEHARSRSKVHLNLRVGEYGNSCFTDHMEELSIRYESDTDEQRSVTFLGPELFEFHIDKWGYICKGSTYLDRGSSTSYQYSPGLLICLFIMMVHPDYRAQFIKYLKSLEIRLLKPFLLSKH